MDKDRQIRELSETIIIALFESSGGIIPYEKRTKKEKAVANNYDKKMNSKEWKSAYKEEPKMHFTKKSGHSPLADELLKDLAREGKKSGAQILDIGSGLGRDSIYLAKHGHKVSGIDVSKKVVKLANKMAITAKAKATFMVGDAENLYQFEDGSQDAVLSIAALHSTPIKFTFGEVYRVLKPGGQAKVFLYTKTKTGSKWISYWTPGEIKQYAEENGFKIEKFREKHNSEPIKIPGLDGEIEQETHQVIATLRKPKKESGSMVDHLGEEIARELFPLQEGGGGSGNWGHVGRPGMRGGSLPTKAGSIATSILKSEKGGFRFPKLSGKLFRTARKVRNLEVIASGSPKKMARRALNILIGRTIVRKLFR